MLESSSSSFCSCRTRQTISWSEAVTSGSGVLCTASELPLPIDAAHACHVRTLRRADREEQDSSGYGKTVTINGYHPCTAVGWLVTFEAWL